MTSDWKSLSDMATVVGAGVAAVTAISLASLWVMRRRAAKLQRLSVHLERPQNDLFFLVIHYRPEDRSQAHFADVGSLGSNPIYLLPRAQSEEHRRHLREQFGEPTWPKDHAQWTGGRLHPHAGEDFLSTKFEIIPRTTDAAGWLYIRIYTKGPTERTLIWRRTAVSLLA